MNIEGRYVFDAFDVGVFQYLVNHVNKENFTEAFRKAVMEILLKEEQLEKICASIWKKGEGRKRSIFYCIQTLLCSSYKDIDIRT